MEAIMGFNVTSVIDGDTVRVSPGWEWRGESGDIVRVLGYNAPEKGKPGYDAYGRQIARLTLNKQVELRNPIKLSYGRLLCEVWLNGRNIADYFN